MKYYTDVKKTNHLSKSLEYRKFSIGPYIEMDDFPQNNLYY